MYPKRRKLSFKEFAGKARAKTVFVDGSEIPAEQRINDALQTITHNPFPQYKRLVDSLKLQEQMAPSPERAELLNLMITMHTQIRKYDALAAELSSIAVAFTQEKAALLNAAKLAPRIQPHWVHPEGLLTTPYQQRMAERAQQVEASALNGTHELDPKRVDRLLAGRHKSKSALEEIKSKARAASALSAQQKADE